MTEYGFTVVSHVAVSLSWPGVYVGGPEGYREFRERGIEGEAVGYWRGGGVAEENAL